ncbi:hypothetical protein DICSQDRAFT_172777 [Dichomitus squalens LYAD-421 SS1]|uniref:F-box domain-containing protein n=1 Tax=Dichomitus squalens (strain LYAD-421) TaxID=732165 RepID=R7SS58_DICSQ|nr:uncharacterized protein DICSQDRAFT_172777 [Dichomitus squalens LYAD-421 SS1]EJF58575.1 hypothetical protein DICSQDRAFT_172777 [Dichomitus squalens LYAD-421 SS1]
MPLHLLDLNEDVLNHVVDKLYGGNALRFSLASKRTYEVAIHRVAAVVKCRRSDRLALIHRVLLNGPRPRAHHIEDLVIHAPIFLQGEAPYLPQVRDSNPDMLSLILDLISNAPKLRRLTLCEVDASLQRDPRMETVLLGLRNLNRIEFAGSTRWNLTVLSLHNYATALPSRVTAPPEELWPQLFDTIAAFPQFHTLDIADFRTDDKSFRDIDGYTPPTFPALRKLFLFRCSSDVLDLACLSPYLHTLDADLAWGQFDLMLRVASRPGPRLSPLRSVLFSSILPALYATELMNTAYHLRITRTTLEDNLLSTHHLGVHLRERQAAALVEIVRTVSPVRAQLAAVIGDQSTEFWQRISLAAPRMKVRAEAGLSINAGFESRVSELVVPRLTITKIQDNIPAMLASLPLIGLRLHCGKMPELSKLQYSNDPLYEYDDAVYDAQKKLARELYSTRVQIMKSLPRRLTNAIHGLRVVAIADEEPDADYDGTPHVPRPLSESVGDHLDDSDEYEYQASWYAHFVKSLEWWRVMRNEEETVRLEALTWDQGTRVQRFFEDSDMTGLERIDGESS